MPAGMTDARLQRDLNALVDQQGKAGLERRLPEAKVPQGIEPKAVSRPKTAPTRSTAGIASPLTEVAGKRTYYDTVQEVKSIDGIFSVRYNPLKTVTMRDANGSEVVFSFADPTAPPPAP